MRSPWRWRCGLGNVAMARKVKDEAVYQFGGRASDMVAARDATSGGWLTGLNRKSRSRSMTKAVGEIKVPGRIRKRDLWGST